MTHKSDAHMTLHHIKDTDITQKKFMKFHRLIAPCIQVS